MTTTAAPSPDPTVRELIAQLAAAEDDLRECRRPGATRQREAVLRRQAHIVTELRRRRTLPR